MAEKKFRSGFVAIVGRPNVGKSTLMNHLVGQKIAITSGKPQTTRNQIRTIYTSEDGQIVFLDTPGIHRAKNRLGEFMDDVALQTLTEADVILWLVEASKDLAVFMEKYRKLYPFEEIIPVSAMKSMNLDSLLDEIFRHLPEGPKYFDEDEVTDQTMRQIAAEMIREKALRCLSDEVPHGIAVQILSMKERTRRNAPKDPEKVYENPDTIWDIEAAVITEKESHKGMIIGKGGSMLKRIGTGARIAIEDMVGAQVNLKLFVKVRKDWRDNPLILKNLGYDKSSLKS